MSRQSSMGALTCSAVNLFEHVDPIGSAGTYDRLVLVECALPWPEDVSSIPALASAGGDKGTRVLAVVPSPGRDPASRRVTVWTASGTGGFHGTELEFDCGAGCDPDEHIASVVRGAQHDHISVVGPARAQVLVCTHGRRDRCCGSLGTSLFLDIADRWPDIEVRRSSHLGGHRFAPTAVVLPDGRCWAHLSDELISGIVERSLTPATAAPHLRGSMPIDEWAQVADRALFERVGWQWLDRAATFTTSVAPDSTTAQVTVTWVGGSATALVAVVGIEALVECGTGLPTGKQSRQFALRSLDLD
jgi:hypothetical protein